MLDLAKKEPNEIVDLVINYSLIFIEDNPTDQIATSAWAVALGDIVVNSNRIEAPDKAIARVSGGTKYGSLHYLVNTITCISGQKYVRTIPIQLEKK